MGNSRRDSELVSNRVVWARISSNGTKDPYNPRTRYSRQRITDEKPANQWYLPLCLCMGQQQKKTANGTDDHERRRIKKQYPLGLKPTFPLDIDEINNMRDHLVINTPKFLVWSLLAQLGSRFSLLSRFSESWAKIEPELSEAVVEHVIKQSNFAQNQVLRSLIDALDLQCEEYAETLRQFLWLKQSVERSLKLNRSMSAQRGDIETLVDSIVQEVCYEVLTVSDLQTKLARSQVGGSDLQRQELKQRIENCHERIARALETLTETEQRTRVPDAPPMAIEDEPVDFESQVLDKLIETLRQENEVAKSINDRIQHELPSHA